MRKFLLFALSTGILCLAVMRQVRAQAFGIDTTSKNQKLKNAIAIYNNATGETGSFYNGFIYEYFPHSIKGNPYFIADDFKDGFLLYDHVCYYNIKLMYDMVRELVIPLTFNDDRIFSLKSEKVSAFSISSHQFKRVVTDTTNNTLETGFYEILYPGKTEVLLRKTVDIQNGTPPEKYFKDHISYYIKHGSAYYKVSNKGSTLNILKDKKNELQQRSKKPDISFGERKGDAIVALASYYDEISK